MRKSFFIFALFFLTGLCFAQVQVKLTQPPPNQLKATDLWKAILTNLTTTTYRISIEGTLDEKVKGRVANGHSVVMDLPPGTKTINYDDVKIGIATSIFDKWGNLIFGNGDYTICIKVKDDSGKEIGSGCIVQSVQICDVKLILKFISAECITTTHGNNNYKICIGATYTSSNYNLTYSNAGSGFKAYPPSYTPAYTVSSITPALQIQNSGSTTTVNYCFNVSVPVGQSAIKVGLQGDDKDPGPIVCQPGAELDIKLPNCITCDCGKWTPLVLNLTTGQIKYECGSRIDWNCNKPFKFETTYQCNPANDASCQAKTSWEIKKDGTLIKSGSGTNNIADGFTPTANGTFTITLNASCNGIKCPPCTYTIIVKDCGSTCDCGKWTPLIVYRVSYECGSRIEWNCNKLFKFETTYQCSPANDVSCQAKTTWEIKKDGTLIKSGNGTNNIADGFTPTANGTYTITLNASCNGMKCPPCTYTIIVKDCGSTCDCGKWTPLVLNLATGQIKYECGSRIEWNCNKPFKFETTYQCSPANDASCQAKTSWEIKKDGTLIKSGNGTNNITDGFTPTANGTYTITLNASCNGIKCPPCSYTIIIKDCGSACDCTKDMYVIVNPGNFKVRCKETKIFDFGTIINLIPQNICDPADCLTQWSMKVFDAQSGTLVTTGNGSGNSSSFALTLNSSTGYRIELVGNCNGNKCSCEFWIRTKPQSKSGQ